MNTRKLIGHAVAAGGMLAALIVAAPTISRADDGGLTTIDGPATASAPATGPCSNTIGEPPCDAPPVVTMPPPNTAAPPTTTGCTNVIGELPCDAPPPPTPVDPPTTLVPPTTTGCTNTVGQPPCEATTSTTVRRSKTTAAKTTSKAKTSTKRKPTPLEVQTYRCTVGLDAATTPACDAIPGVWNGWKGRQTPPRWDPCGRRGPFTLFYFLPCGPMTPTIKQWCTLHFDHRYIGVDMCAVANSDGRQVAQ